MRRPTTALKKVAARASPPLVFSSFPFFLLTLLFMDPWLAVKWGGSTAGPLVGAQIYALHAWICAPLSSRRRSMVAVGQRPRQPPRKLPTRALHRAACPSSSSAWGTGLAVARSPLRFGLRALVHVGTRDPTTACTRTGLAGTRPSRSAAASPPAS
jgi:hypothetical protein